MRIPACTTALTVALLASPPTRAAESYENCTGFIDSVPAVIATQGTWCLRQDLASALANGVLIDVTANNITIDCNHFKLGGLAAGAGTSTLGIRALNRQGITVRNCNIRGFYSGISLEGGNGGGHLVEGNRLEHNTRFGIYSQSPRSLVRGNLVKDTGGYSGINLHAIYSEAGTVAGNVVDGVLADAGATDATGIFCFGQGAVRDNVIRGVEATSTGEAYGIVMIFSHCVARGNDIIGVGATSDYGIFCDGNDSSSFGNTVLNVTTGVTGCATYETMVNPN